MAKNPLGNIQKKIVEIYGVKTTVWDVTKSYKWLDEDGNQLYDKKGRKKYKEKFKRCFSYSEAVSALQNMPEEIEKEKQKEIEVKIIENKEKTFFELCDWFEKEKIIAPVYVGRRKVAGYALSNHTSMKTYIKTFKEFFGDVPLSQLTYNDLVKFTNYLSVTPSKQNLPDKKPRYFSAASINHKLSLLRHILTVAVDELDWLVKSPFKRGPKLIDKAAENKRERLMSHAEEELLIKSLDKPHRGHVKAYIILSVDTTMRRGEVFKMKWWQVDLKQRVIYLTEEAAKNSKTGAEGILPMTPRVYEILNSIKFGKAKDDLVIGKTDFKRAWKAACNDANIKNLQFRDLRATAIVRMLESGTPGEFVKKISRHSKDTDIFLKHYTRVNLSNAQNVGKKLHEYNEKFTKQTEK